MHPSIQPFREGHLSLPDDTKIFWELSGNAEGVPVLYLHGGPGGGLGLGGYRRRFDPQKYLIVGMEQRGCYRSTPNAADDLSSLAQNNTQTVIDDIERLRVFLGIDQWAIHGVSWGSTLALAYALEHSNRILAIVLAAVTAGSREEIEWITEGMGRLFPEEWSRFASVCNHEDERVIEAYARLLQDSDMTTRLQAAAAWDRWESTHISLDPNWVPGPMFFDPQEQLNFATLVTHYWAHDCFLAEEKAILSRIGELDGIPGVLLHGRHDISGPVSTAWKLHQNWPGSRLAVVEHEGHGGNDMMQMVADFFDEFV